MNKIRVNVSRRVNGADIRKETRNGREVIIVPSATMPDDVVMNGILYPADEIADSFFTLDRTPAPLGHPVINGEWVSARDVEAINAFHIGAYNDKTVRHSGRVHVDKVIDVAFASATEGGQRVLAAIEAGDPIHTSTGLLCNLEAAPDDAAYKFVARNIFFDHDAILLDEPGAATPEQGVGMMVNSQTGVINSYLDDVDNELDYLGARMIEAMRRKEDAGLWARIKDTVLAALSPERAIANSQKDAEMTVTKEQFDALSAQVNALADTVNTMPDAIANAVKPLVDQMQAMQANAKAAEDAERAALVADVVAGGLLDAEADAEGMTVNALRKLASKAKPKDAAPLAGHFSANAETVTFVAPE